MQHGRPWRSENVTGWLASEKLDGCRVYWDGARMWSRSGRAFPIPPVWAEKLPAMHLDGEIWAGRGKWKVTVDAVVRGRWAPEVCFLIFDAPQVAGTWDRRITEVRRRVRCSFAAAVPWQRIEDMQHLAEFFRHVGEGGGEGLMLRCPAAIGYRPGRTGRVLKLTRDLLNGFVPPGRVVVNERMRLARRAVWRVLRTSSRSISVNPGPVSPSAMNRARSIANSAVGSWRMAALKTASIARSIDVIPGAS